MHHLKTQKLPSVQECVKKAVEVGSVYPVLTGDTVAKFRAAVVAGLDFAELPGQPGDTGAIKDRV